eukprot:5934185-Pyramimonas_sp.AAC.1
MLGNGAATAAPKDAAPNNPLGGHGAPALRANRPKGADPDAEGARGDSEDAIQDPDVADSPVGDPIEDPDEGRAHPQTCPATAPAPSMRQLREAGSGQSVLAAPAGPHAQVGCAERCGRRDTKAATPSRSGWKVYI